LTCLKTDEESSSDKRDILPKGNMEHQDGKKGSKNGKYLSKFNRPFF
jgi:hypothetical protein